MLCGSLFLVDKLFLVYVIIGEQFFPNLSATVGVCDGRVRDALPLNAEASHCVCKTRVNELGMIFVHISYVFKRATADLGLEIKTLLLGFVDILDVAVVGGNTVRDDIVRICKQFLDFGSYLLKSGRVLHHFGSNSVNLFGLFPLLCVRRLDKCVHNELAVSVNNGNGDDLVPVIKACKLKVEEKNLFALHVEGLSAIRVADLASLRKVELVAVLAKLLLVAHVLATLDAHKGLTDAGLFVIELNLCAVLCERDANRLLNCFVMKLIKTLLGEKSVGCGAARAHSFNDRATRKYLKLLLGIAEVPVVNVRLFKRVGTEIEDNALVVVFTERAGKRIGL